MAENQYRDATIPEIRDSIAGMRRAVESPEHTLTPLPTAGLLPLVNAVERLCQEVARLVEDKQASPPSRPRKPIDELFREANQ